MSLRESLFSPGISATDSKISLPNALTVGQLTDQIKSVVEGRFENLWVVGEISNFRPSSSGHLYFSLKDDTALLSCALFKGVYQAALKAKVELKDGVQVLVRGRCSVYKPRGQYQFIVEHIQPLGHGALQLAFEQLKQKLQSEGLFDQARKKTLPSYPQEIVLITSPTGAALQDMLNVLGRRNTGMTLKILPTLVQGAEAAPKIVRAIEVANQFKLGEVIILARGGGSLEDLWCFNHEDVVRAVAASSIPVISAVGHEIDFTLCDFAADLRAPTPSAAAELVSKNRIELLDTIQHLSSRIKLSTMHRVQALRSKLIEQEGKLISPAEKIIRTKRVLDDFETKLRRVMERKIPEKQMALDDLSNRMERTIQRKVMMGRSSFNAQVAKLESLSPLKVLGRGYTLIRDAQNQEVIGSVAKTRPGMSFEVVFHDGAAQGQFL